MSNGEELKVIYWENNNQFHTTFGRNYEDEEFQFISSTECEWLIPNSQGIEIEDTMLDYIPYGEKGESNEGS